MKKFAIILLLSLTLIGCTPTAQVGPQQICTASDRVTQHVLDMGAKAGQIVATTQESPTKILATQIQAESNDALDDVADIAPALAAIQKVMDAKDKQIADLSTGLKRMFAAVYLGLTVAGVLAIALGMWLLFTGAYKLGGGAVVAGGTVIGAVQVMQRFENWLDKPLFWGLTNFEAILWGGLLLLATATAVYAYYLWTQKKALKEIVGMVDGAVKPQLSVAAKATLAAVADKLQSPTTKAIVAQIRGK